MDEVKKKTLNKVLDSLNKKGIINTRFANDIVDYGGFLTPFPTINSLIGHIPIARFTTIAGPYHTGKGAFCLQTIAYLQNMDPDFMVLWTDAENSFDLDWAIKLGVDLERVIIQRYSEEENTMEKILDSALNIIRESKSIDMWVLDSIGALVPKADIFDSKDKEKSLEGDKMLNLQRKLGEFFRKANVIISPDNKGYKGCAVLCIGQINNISLAA